MTSRLGRQGLVYRRYQLVAPVYNWVSAERLLWAAARARAIQLLRLRPGASVLDVACGTGRNFALTMLKLVRPGGRVAVMDAGYPATPGDSGETVLFRPLASLIGWLAAADGRRQPWQLVERDTSESSLERFRNGYVAVAAGTTPGPPSGEPWRLARPPAD